LAYWGTTRTNTQLCYTISTLKKF